MNLLFPVIERKLLAPMLGLTLLGGWIGGIYGVLHDLLTFSISPEYFTKLKFTQFAWANLGLPERAFAAEVGFLATGAVGLAVGWFLARAVLPHWTGVHRRREMARALTLVIAIALLGGAAGYWLGLRHTADYSQWQGLCETLGVRDVPAFVRVAYIHNAGYLGGFSGLLGALVWLRIRRRKSAAMRGAS